MTTLEELRKLPPVLDVPAAAALLGIGRTAAYAAIRAGTWPTPVLRLGRLVRIPSGPLLQLLGVSGDSDARSTPTDPAPRPPDVIGPTSRKERHQP